VSLDVRPQPSGDIVDDGTHRLNVLLDQIGIDQ